MRSAEIRSYRAPSEVPYRGAREAGFTLIEVIIGLMVSAAVLLAARGVIENLSTSEATISAAAKSADTDANAERLLRSVVGRLEMRWSDTSTFSGDEGSATFGSWCEVPRGWLERCAVMLGIEPMERERLGLVLRIRGEQIAILQATRTITLRYLADPAAGGAWVTRWGRGLTAPRAIGVIVDDDTLILRIGERG